MRDFLIGFPQLQCSWIMLVEDFVFDSAFGVRVTHPFILLCLSFLFLSCRWVAHTSRSMGCVRSPSPTSAHMADGALYAPPGGTGIVRRPELTVLPRSRAAPALHAAGPRCSNPRRGQASECRSPQRMSASYSAAS